jgi:hypothetical protein
VLAADAEYGGEAEKMVFKTRNGLFAVVQA